MKYANQLTDEDLTALYMLFTDKELEQIRYALEHLHDADLSEFGNDNIKSLESAMTKLGIKFSSQL